MTHDLKQRLVEIRSDHLSRAKVCSERGFTRRTAFHHDAASTLTETIAALKGEERNG